MYDLVIVGAGPAGLTASIYASCYHLSHLVIGKEIGGQLLLAPDILNYPGSEHITGKELTERMVSQVKSRGGEIVIDSVVNITQLPTGPAARVSQPLASNSLLDSALKHGEARSGSPSLASPVSSDSNTFQLTTQKGDKYQTKAIILATGTERRKLNVPGEVEYTSKGVYYCATCEKFDYEGKACGVVGGANSAVQAAVELSQAAAKVYIIYRGTQLRGDPVWLEQVDKHPNIEVIYNTVVREIVGDGEKLTGVKLSNYPINNKQATKTPRGWQAETQAQAMTPPMVDESRRLPLDKLFIEIGGVPGTALVIPLGVAMDPGGYIKTDERLATNVDGIFAAGDLITFGLNIEQISSAVGLGARAAASAFAFLKGEKAPTVWGGAQIKR